MADSSVLATLLRNEKSVRHSTPQPPTAMIPAWIVCAWPPLLWQASAAAELHLVHLGTRVLSFGDRAGHCSGQTLWGETSSARTAGVAWDWVQIQQGVVALADPLGLITNLKLLDAQGAALNVQQTAIHLNQIVHSLPWQTEVQRALTDPTATTDRAPAPPG